MSGYCLTVSTRDMTRAFHLLARFEKSTVSAELTLVNGLLAVKAGGSVEEMPASGTWPRGSVIISARTGVALSRVPFTGTAIDLRVFEGKLHLGTLAVPCEIGSSKVGSVDDGGNRVEAAFLLLARYNVTKEQVAELAEKGRPENAALWLGADVEMFGVVSRVWEILAPLGVEGCDVRRLINESLRRSFTSSAGRLK